MFFLLQRPGQYPYLLHFYLLLTWLSPTELVLWLNNQRFSISVYHVFVRYYNDLLESSNYVACVISAKTCTLTNSSYYTVTGVHDRWNINSVPKIWALWVNKWTIFQNYFFDSKLHYLGFLSDFTSCDLNQNSLSYKLNNIFHHWGSFATLQF